MDHADHVRLLRPAIPTPTPDAVWADIGSGEGAFTLALADLLGPGATIIAVDRDADALRQNAQHLNRSFPDTKWIALNPDFREALSLPELDGIVAANSLHFVKRSEQASVVATLAHHLAPGGTFLVVEYDADGGNHWVPDPVFGKIVAFIG